MIEDAFEYANGTTVTALRDVLARMREAADDGDAAASVRADRALHARVAETSPNPILRPFYLSLLEIIESHTLAVIALEGTSLTESLNARYELHADLVETIATRDPRALDVIRSHNTSTPPVDSATDPRIGTAEPAHA